MNILVLSSVMSDNDFDTYPVSARYKPNSSNQNFYSKLVRALAFDNNVAVVSVRPLVKGMLDENRLDSLISIQDRVPFYYSKVRVGRFYKVFKQVNDIVECAEEVIKSQNFVSFTILVDTLRPNLVKAAKQLRKKYRCNIVGVVTDNPYNLSNTPLVYKHSVLKNANNLNGYIALTKKLDKIFNKYRRPVYLTEGFVDDVNVGEKLPIGDYIFFGGSLYERYGVKTLIDAYLSLPNYPYKLVIAGNGELRQYIYNLTNSKKNILFLSVVDRKSIYNLEHHAMLNINPRPFTRALDEESVPSKLLEYFASGTITMSTRNTRLQEIFKDSVIWLEKDNKEAIRSALYNFATADQKNLKKKAYEALGIVYREYSLKTQGSKISDYLMTLPTLSPMKK